MSRKKLLVIVVLVFCNLTVAQKINYEEILANAKNIKSAYLNRNSILLKTGNSTLKWIDIKTKKEKVINIPGKIKGYPNQISQTKNGQYFTVYSNGEMNHNGMFIENDGTIKTTFELSTPYAKSSPTGQYIITTKTHIHDGGYFQIFIGETLEEYKIPGRSFYSFKADFIDADRVFLLFKEMSIDKVGMNEYKKNNPEDKRGAKRKFSTITAKYLIYNIFTKEIEYEDELIINSKKYLFVDDEIRMAISDDGKKVLLSSYSKIDNIERHYYHNSLLSFDIMNYELKDVSNKISHGIDDGIVNISFINSDIFVSVQNKRTTKYYYMDDDNVFSIKHNFTRNEIGKNDILPIILDDDIKIIDSRNRELIWEYKKNNKISVSKNKIYPIFSIDNKIKEIKEVQE